MSDFEPTGDFVSRVMSDVRVYERSRHFAIRTESGWIVFSRVFRYALSVGGVLFAAANILRIASTLIAPAVCR